MIPEKKRTPEEIAALREDLGIPEPVAKEVQRPAPEMTSPPDEPVIHLDIPSIPVATPAPQNHRLRKSDLPLAPAPIVTSKTELPTHRHAPGDIAQIRKREALAQLEAPGQDPAAILRTKKASPFLYGSGYLAAIAAAVSTYHRVHPANPLALVGISLLITLFIAARKPRSHHHAAFIFIVVFLTAALGAIHYAPLFQYGP